MEIVVDIDDPRPLFAQLIEQVKAAVQSAKLTPGDPLPSIRQLANDLELNNKNGCEGVPPARARFGHPDAGLPRHVRPP